jgi:hypothetical protein
VLTAKWHDRGFEKSAAVFSIMKHQRAFTNVTLFVLMVSHVACASSKEKLWYRGWGGALQLSHFGV